MCGPATDLCAFRSLATLPEVQNAWLSALLQPSHNIVVRSLRQSVPAGPWYFPLGNWGGTMVMLWPLEEVRIPGEAGVFELSRNLPGLRDLYTVCWDLGEWQAWRIRWRSPLWQSTRFAGTASLLPMKIRAFSVGPIETLQEAAARQAFWTLNKTFLVKLAGYLAVELQSTTDLIMILERMVCDILKISASEANDIMVQRLATMEGRTPPGVEELVDIPDAMLCVGTQEFHDLQDTVARNGPKAAAVSQFREAWSKRRAEVKPASKSKAKARRGARASEPLELPQGDLFQPQLRPLLPPGGSIWRGNKSGTWSTHYPPFRRCSKSWNLHGHRGAAVLALRDCWEKHLLMEGLPVSACPVRGLFEANAEDAALPPSAPGAAASSG